MKSLLSLFAFSASTCLATVTQACGGLSYLQEDSPESVEQVQQFVQERRALGPQGLTTALEEYRRSCRGMKETTPQTHQRWYAALDQIAAQRGAATSQLYWYTDLEAAKAAAAKTDKPILSLRMLGKLTDEYSCANSRFFRTTLYANEEISTALRDRFILHWQSVRPVPKVTIDFGDGRKLERTLTGNSAHYVIDTNGEVLDVLPGLYSPQAFGEWLDRVESLAKVYPDRLRHDPRSDLRRYHRQREREILSAWQTDLNKVNPELNIHVFKIDYANLPKAVEATEIAAPKAAAEAPIVRQLVPADEQLAQATTASLWQKIADLHRHETKLDQTSVAIIRAEHEDAQAAMRRAMSKRFIEDPILAMVHQFESNIALDTVKNEYQLHRQIHRWFADGSAPRDFDQLNEKVYAELFLTPSSDPWLGLAPANVYTALENGGKTELVSEATTTKVKEPQPRPRKGPEFNYGGEFGGYGGEF